VGKILESFDSQVNLMHELEVDVAQLAKINVDVLKNYDKYKEFENSILAASSKFICRQCSKLNFQIGNQLERTQSIELVAEAGNKYYRK
jgi:hypothetical protein